MSKPRCGLCNKEIEEETFDDHVKTEEHQNNLPKYEKEVKIPVVPVKEISEAEKKQNIKEQKMAKAENLGYYSVANGLSYFKCRCECAELVDVYAWRGCKRCPNCGKVIVTHMMRSFREMSK